MARSALVVHNDVTAAQHLADQLRAWRFEAVWLRQEDTSSLTGSPPPDVVLLDRDLPGDYRNVLWNLRLTAGPNLTPVVLLGEREPPELHRGVQVAAHESVRRPAPEARLRAACARALGWRAERERAGVVGEVTLHLLSAARYLGDLSAALAPWLHAAGLDAGTAQHLNLAVRELAANAIEWGHRNDANRVVTIVCRVLPAQVAVTIRDTGPGFDRSRLPHAARPADPTAHLAVRQALRLREGGFGILLADGLVDELRYNDRGNEVCVVKHLPEGRAVLAS